LVSEAKRIRKSGIPVITSMRNRQCAGGLLRTPVAILLRLAVSTGTQYVSFMVIIRFEDSETEKRALDYLIGRFSFKSWANGELMLPPQVLGRLAAQGIPFHVQGPATYEHFLPVLRNPAPTPV
jgi:hypothetical protein